MSAGSAAGLRVGVVAVGLVLVTAALAACGSDQLSPEAASSPSGSATSSTTASGAPAHATVSRAATPAPPVAVARGADVVPPPANAEVDYQLGGPYPPAPSVEVVDRDRSATPVRGRYTICYVNAFQTQPEDEAFWRRGHPDLLARDAAGRPIGDPDWPGEYLLDTSTAARRTALAAIESRWVDGCASKGFQAVEPDNLDSWTRSGGRLTQAGNLAFAAVLTARAHADGLAVAQKNTPQLGDLGRSRVGFDFAVAEECQVYAECDAYTHVYGPHVIEIEYTDNPRSAYTQACAARGRTISIILRDRDVVPRGQDGYHDETC